MSYPALLLQAPGGASGGFTQLIFLGAIFAVFYFFIIRPQSKKQKEIQQKVSDVKRGDKVVTSGGLVLTVSVIKEDHIISDIGGSKLKVLKSAIVDVNPKGKDDASSKEDASK